MKYGLARFLKLAPISCSFCNNDGQVYRVHGYLRFQFAGRHRLFNHFARAVCIFQP